MSNDEGPGPDDGDLAPTLGKMDPPALITHLMRMGRQRRDAVVAEPAIGRSRRQLYDTKVLRIFVDGIFIGSIGGFGGERLQPACVGRFGIHHIRPYMGGHDLRVAGNVRGLARGLRKGNNFRGALSRENIGLACSLGEFCSLSLRLAGSALRGLIYGRRFLLSAFVFISLYKT